MSETYQLTGTVKEIMDLQTFESGFCKREFVVTSEDQWPQSIKLEAVKDKCASLDSVQIGQRVTVKFNLRGNEYNGRYYVNLQAWYIAADTTPPAETQQEPPSGDSGSDAYDGEQMPF